MVVVDEPTAAVADDLLELLLVPNDGAEQRSDGIGAEAGGDDLADVLEDLPYRGGRDLVAEVVRAGRVMWRRRAVSSWRNTMI